jgi:segregation and condensation protein B
MFGTTKLFLDYFGLKKLDDLPPLADLSDWESLRVQLNLPEVEEDTSDELPAIPDIPVLYPEIREADTDDVSDAAIAEAVEAVEAIEATLVETQEDAEADVEEEDELVVSEWPDPVKSGG